MTNWAIESSDLCKDRLSGFIPKKQRVIDHLNLRVEANQTYGLLGLNGAGKTTTVKLLLGLIKPSLGRLTVLGEAAGSPQALKRIGFLPESPYFYSHLTGFEFLDFAGRLCGIADSVRHKRIEELLLLVSLKDAAALTTGKYSKGMLQRLGIAQSLINDPDLLLWDEPTSGLDPIGRHDVRSILLELKGKGKTIVFITHLLSDVAEICDTVGILHKGKLIREAKLEEITKSRDPHQLESYFMEAVFQAGYSSSDLVKLESQAN